MKCTFAPVFGTCLAPGAGGLVHLFRPGGLLGAIPTKTPRIAAPVLKTSPSSMIFFSNIFVAIYFQPGVDHLHRRFISGVWCCQAEGDHRRSMGRSELGFFLVRFLGGSGHGTSDPCHHHILLGDPTYRRMFRSPQEQGEAMRNIISIRVVYVY